MPKPAAGEPSSFARSCGDCRSSSRARNSASRSPRSSSDFSPSRPSVVCSSRCSNRSWASAPVHGVSLAVAFGLVTVVQMIVAELIPKGLAIARPDRASRLLAPFITVYGTVFGPVIRVLNGAADVDCSASGHGTSRGAVRRSHAL